MAEEPLQESFSGSTKVLFGTIGFLLLMLGGEIMLEKQEPRLALGAILCGLGVLCFYMVWAGRTIRQRLPVARLNAIAAEPRWWVVSILVLVAAITSWRVVEVAFLRVDAAKIQSLETEKSTLIEQLQQSQMRSDEARRDYVAVEAQKATLVQWLQSAQRERDVARQQYDQLQKNLQAQRSRSTSQIYPLLAPPTAAQECINLAQRLADLDPDWTSEKGKIEHIRAAMTALGCGCDTLKK